ncbi:MAG: response regulator [Cyanothece sp. SIO1E1]|nr:response regulator [Cyanothece sp. SIO1E1]
MIRVWSESLEWLWILLWSGVGAAGLGIVAGIRRRRNRTATRFMVLAVYITLTGGTLVTSGYLAFFIGWWIPVMPSLVALIGSASAIASYQVLNLQQQRLELAQQKLKMEQEKIRAETASQAKSQFLAKMSHELRTPLNAILGFTQLMSSDAALSPHQKEHLGIISRSGEHLLSLINDVLEMSKIEAGRLTLNETSVDLHRMLDSLREMLEFKAASEGLKLIFEQAATVPQFVKTDEGKLRQVLINLLGNAIKFTEAGRVVLRVGLGVPSRGLDPRPIMLSGNSRQLVTDGPSPLEFDPRDALPAPALIPDPQSLYFEVEDTGPGIPVDEIDKLFDPFAQGETGQKSESGTGLGLPISQQFVSLMGGEITVSSSLGQGTVFRFNIPVKRLQQAVRAKTVQPTRKVMGLMPNQPAYRILVAEDDRVNRLLMNRIMKPLGFQVREAINGQEAIELWQSWQPDLIWMDMQMPVVDGFEATRQIKIGNQQHRSNGVKNSEAITADLTGNLKSDVRSAKRYKTETPAPVIIALTASAFAEDQAMILAAGCDDFVSKPFQREVIFEKMAEHLGVQYLYQEQDAQTVATVHPLAIEIKHAQHNAPSSEATHGTDNCLNASALITMMSAEWVADLHQAATQADDELIFKLIEQIPANHIALARALTDLSHNFHFERIISLTQTKDVSF